VKRLAALLALLLPGAAAAQPAPPPSLNPPPAPAPQNWQGRGNADLRALNKVDAHVTALSMHVGQSVQYGSLTITLRACVARPPDEAADSAAFLDVHDSHAGEPGFTGWMFAAEPQLNMLEHPVYGLRLLACR
jgi:hypothetical protein